MKNIMIKTKDLCKYYEVGGILNKVIRNANVEIYEGDFTVIMGSSGSGKSTLLYALSGMDKITSGEVILLNKSLNNMKEKEIATIRKEKISFIFQSINLLQDLNVLENVTYPGFGKRNKKDVERKAKKILNEFGILERASNYPTEISGGEAQRVAISRALINNPKIIFADEPTGALNSSSGKDVLDVLTNLNHSGQSIVMVTHDLKACSRANRILFLSDGVISGELLLDKYSDKELEEREHTIYEFLKSHNW